jgi:MarR family transcriptional regulator, organic hydroperoxide resistance regulator
MTSSSESPGGPDAWGILAHLWQLVQSILDDSAPALEAIGLTPKAFFLLAAVERHPFPAELARLMHLPPPTVTYMVKLMESKGFLERRAEPCDLRKFRLILTDGGRAAIESGREAIGAVLTARLARLAPEEIGPFDRVVERLARPSAE